MKWISSFRQRFHCRGLKRAFVNEIDFIVPSKISIHDKCLKQAFTEAAAGHFHYPYFGGEFEGAYYSSGPPDWC